VSRAREAYAAKVEEAGKAAGWLNGLLAQISMLVRRDNPPSDDEARRLMGLCPEVLGVPLLEGTAMVEWFDLMLRTEAMDRALGGLGARPESESSGFRGVQTVSTVLPEDVVSRDGATRLGALRDGKVGE
jgi:hypothetical protein